MTMISASKDLTGESEISRFGPCAPELWGCWSGCGYRGEGFPAKNIRRSRPVVVTCDLRGTEAGENGDC